MSNLTRFFWFFFLLVFLTSKMKQQYLANEKNMQFVISLF
jgi:hypothetical protein